MICNKTKEMHVLIGASGSVAGIKVPEIVKEVFSCFPKAEVKVLATKAALPFFDRKELKDTFDVDCLVDEDDWRSYHKRGDPILHIELCKWADLLLIAPCSANTLAKVSNGICDNLLTCVARAWSFDKLFIIAPAMNTNMWIHPITKQHIQTITSWGILHIPPIVKTLACGDTGIGAMEEPSTIIALIHAHTAHSRK